MNKLRTPLDEIGFFLKDNKNKKFEMEDLVKKFHVPPEVLERWLIILEQNKIIKIEYSGLKVLIQYVFSDKEGPVKEEEESIDKKIQEIKEIFIFKSKQKGFPEQEIEEMWKNYLKNYLPQLKKIFYRKAKLKGLSDEDIISTWKVYYYELLKI